MYMYGRMQEYASVSIYLAWENMLSVLICRVNGSLVTTPFWKGVVTRLGQWVLSTPSLGWVAGELHG